MDQPPQQEEAWLNPAIVAAFAVIVGTFYWWNYQKTKPAREAKQIREEKLKIHDSKTNKIYGCLACGKKLLPDDTIFFCGICPEEYSLCEPCQISKPHRHRMFKETIYYEVDPEVIGEANTVSDSLISSFEVYGPRPCLGKRKYSEEGDYDDSEAFAIKIDIRATQSFTNTKNKSYRTAFITIKSSGWTDDGVQTLLDSRELWAGKYWKVEKYDPSKPQPRRPTQETWFKNEKDKAVIPGYQYKGTYIPTENYRGFRGLDYSWISYTDTYKASLQLGASLFLIGAKPRDVILLCAISSPDWYISDYACLLHSLIIVPLHPTSSLNNIVAVLKRAKPSVVIVSEHLEENFYNAISLVKKEDGHEVSSMVLVNDWKGAYPKKNPKFVSDMEKVYSIDTMIDLGKLKLVKDPFVPSSLQYDDIVMLLPTSGSSGQPKLTIVTNSMLLHQVTVPKQGRLTVMYSFEPLRQSLDVLSKGGSIGCFSGSLERIIEDTRLLRPTDDSFSSLGATPALWNVFGATPALWNGFFRTYLNEIEEKKNEFPSSKLWEIIEKTDGDWKCFFGNRCRTAIVVGAASSAELKKWIFNVLNCVVLDGYGTTETGGLSGNSQMHSGITLQLRDCPQLGYLTSDQVREAYISFPPRGEVLAHTSRLTPGYYNDEEATNESFVEIHGMKFFRTGDIGKMENGQIVVVDRISAVFKLSQGLFVPPSPLENLYIQSNQIEQIFIYGDYNLSSVVAVLVPSSTALEEMRNHFKIKDLDMKTVCVDDTYKSQLNKIILKEIRKLGKDQNCKVWEIPNLLVLEYDRFSPENGFLTTIGKLCRPALTKHYRPIIHKLLNLKEGGTIENEPVSISINSNVSEVSTDLNGGFVKLIASVSPSPILKLNGTDSLSDLGFDSVALTGLSNSIKNQYNVSITVPMLAKFPSLFHLQMGIFGGSSNISMFLVATDTKSSSERWEKEITKSYEPIKNLKLIKKELKGNGVLLTGVTGYLGAFLLESILDQKKTSNVYCLVRAKSKDTGMTRIKENLKIYLIWEDEMEKRLIPICGDLSEENLGISKSDFQLLEDNVSIIYHNGAVVNSFLPYSSVYKANVIGTQTLLKLAFSIGSSIQFHYVSTIGLLAGSGVPEEIKEVPSVALSYLSGYSQSKWVAEQIVIKAWEKGLKGNIYRPGTVFSSTKTGASNRNDSVILTLSGLIREETTCFDSESPLIQAFPLVPVDWVAGSITEISTQTKENNKIFHLINTNTTSLKKLIERIKNSGFNISEETSKNFKEKISELGVDHPLYVFQSVLVSGGYKTGDKKTGPKDPNTMTVLSTIHKKELKSCPFITDQIIDLMIKYCVQEKIFKKDEK